MITRQDENAATSEEPDIESTIDIDSHTLSQIRVLSNSKDEVGLVCMDGCANAGVISSQTHKITNVVAKQKANLAGAQTNFQSRGLPIGTGVTAVVSQLDLSKPMFSWRTMKLVSMMTRRPCVLTIK